MEVPNDSEYLEVQTWTTFLLLASLAHHHGLLMAAGCEFGVVSSVPTCQLEFEYDRF